MSRGNTLSMVVIPDWVDICRYARPSGPMAARVVIRLSPVDSIAGSAPFPINQAPRCTTPVTVGAAVGRGAVGGAGVGGAAVGGAAVGGAAVVEAAVVETAALSSAEGTIGHADSAQESQPGATAIPMPSPTVSHRVVPKAFFLDV